jgi:hypothetical protein
MQIETAPARANALAPAVVVLMKASRPRGSCPLWGGHGSGARLFPVSYLSHELGCIVRVYNQRVLGGREKRFLEFALPLGRSRQLKRTPARAFPA